MVLDQPGRHVEAPGPMVGGSIWREVVGAAGGRCECTGGCGRKYSKSGGRCTRGNSPPLHAVAARPAATGPVGEMQLRAGELIALCDLCHAGVQADRRRQDRVAAAARLASDQGTLW
jgi:hypothetical protein